MPHTPPLPPNQIIITDKDCSFSFFYIIDDPDELEFLKQHGERDEAGNLVLSYPLAIAAARRQKNTPDIVISKIEQYCEELHLPPIQINSESSKTTVNLDELVNASNEELEKHLFIYGGYRSVLEAHLANIESKKGVLETSFEEGLNRMLYTLELKYIDSSSRRPNKESLRGEALSANPLLRKTRQELIEMEGLYYKIRGLRDAYRAAYETISRVISLRGLGKET